MDYYLDILRLLAEFVQLAREHPIWVSVSAVALAVLRYLAGGIGSATVSHVWTEYVLKRVLPPAPSPAEDELRARVEDETRARARAEGELVAERRRIAQLEAELGEALAPGRPGQHGRDRPRS